MRIKLSKALATLLLPGSALAQDAGYQSQLQRIRSQEAAISNRLSSLKTQYGFAAEARTEDVAGSRGSSPSKLLRVHGDLRGAVLPSGKLLFGKTVSRLVVGGETSPVLLELDDRQGPASGLRMLGTARASASSGRVQVEIQKLLLPSQAVALQGVALDSEGAQGLVAEVFSSKAWSVAGAMAGSFIAGLASGQQTQAVTSLGFTQTQATGRNAILQGVAQTAADQSKRLIEEATAEKPILVVEAGALVTVLIQEEVRF